MASARDLWKKSFFDSRIPEFPCPRCDRGNLHLHDKVIVLEPEYSREAQVKEDLSPPDGNYCFSLFLKCGVSKCGELVTVHGTAELREEFGGEWNWWLTPKDMHPAPPLSTIPPQTPDVVGDELRLAFRLFWVDLGSCANRLRISVERMLDD